MQKPQVFCKAALGTAERSSFCRLVGVQTYLLEIQFRTFCGGEQDEQMVRLVKRCLMKILGNAKVLFDLLNTAMTPFH